MILFRHELRRNRVPLALWASSIALMLLVCMLIFPEMKSQFDMVNSLFKNLGAFTAAFGMDRLNFGTLIGFYAVECGNILGLGGAFFASLIAVSALAKEEKERTAEFLLSHPVSRVSVISSKLSALVLQIVIMNALVFALSAACIVIIGEEPDWKEICLLHLAYFLLQLELAGICFGISAFLRWGSLGIGLGIAAIMYFLNIIANISEKAEFLKYITPFGYAEGADIVSNASLDGKQVLVGMAFAVVGVAAAYFWYSRKDIH